VDRGSSTLWYKVVTIDSPNGLKYARQWWRHLVAVTAVTKGRAGCGRKRETGVSLNFYIASFV